MKRQMERRSFAAEYEVRESPGGLISITGHAAVYDQLAYGEVIRPGAFDKTMAGNPDVRMLVNHDGVPIARTKSGTLELSLDDEGLLSHAPDLDPENPTVQEVSSAMKRKDLDAMSFAFWPVLERDDEDGNRELLEVKIDGGDVSIVTYPWYDETSVSLNSIDTAIMCLRSGKPLTSEQRDTVTQWITVTLEVDDLDDEPAVDQEIVSAPGGMSLALARSLASL